MEQAERERLAEEIRQAMGKQAPQDPLSGVPFPQPILCSDLSKMTASARWVWQGCLAREGITLLSAYWKAGKSTLLSHLLRALAKEKEFCGLPVSPCHVLYVTEEGEDIWADRRDELGLADNVAFQVRPFPSKPFWGRWAEFLLHLKAERDRRPYDLLFLDTVSNLWPVRDENDAAQVQSALMPLRTLGAGLATMAVHHLRKGDGPEATGSRGSGAFPAFVDILLELRRYNPSDSRDRRRVLSGVGRYRETPAELVIELSEDGKEYRAVGDKVETGRRDLSVVIPAVLPSTAPGATYDEIANEWPGDTSPKRKALLDALHAGANAGLWHETGTGKRGSPHRWWKPSGNSVPCSSPIGGGTGNGNGDRVELQAFRGDDE